MSHGTNVLYKQEGMNMKSMANIKNFERIYEETRHFIQTIDDGIKCLFDWNNRLSELVNDIIGYNEEEILSENTKKLSETHQISMDVAKKVAELSEIIISLSNSINNIIQACDNTDKKLDQSKHNTFIFQVNSGIDIMRTIQRMLNSPDYIDLNDILVGLEKNFRKFYNGYITALNIVDSDKILQRPENY